jgi:predicted amidohydrolase
MAPTIKVAVIQLYSEPLEPEKNFAKAEALIRSAAKDGAELAVLPEYHLTSWSPEDARFAEFALQYREYISRYCSLAKSLKINIVPGTIVANDAEEPSPSSEKLVNIAAFIDSNGDILNMYEKRNLW